MEQKAISDTVGMADLYLATDIKLHSIYKSNESIKSAKIESTSIDYYFKNYNKEVNFIKMDIEGAELRAMREASSFLQKNKNIKIITEFNPILIKRFGGEPEEYLDLLLKNGFQLYNINEQEKNKIYQKFRVVQKISY